jgi:hypothetical protein
VPKPAVLWAIAAAGVAAAAGAVVLAVTSDHVDEPGLQGALMDWVGLPYVLSGLIAWWRRPASRFGPLMVIAGFVVFTGTLQWTSSNSTHDRTGS